MAEVSEKAELGATPAEVWRVVRDWPGVVEMMGSSIEVEGDQGPGQLIKIAGRDSPPPIVERIEELDDDEHRVVYAVISGPFPVARYRSTVQLTPVGEGRCGLSWTGSFDPAPGSSKEQVSARLHSIYQSGIAKLQDRFGS